MTKGELRLIDANLNRIREGIRVVEDIYRYIYNNKKIALELKTLRHQARIKLNNKLLKSRDIQNDVLKLTISSEKNRDNLKSILIANFKRAEESARVLEEFGKLIDIETSSNFKNIRYKLYHLEKTLTAL